MHACMHVYVCAYEDINFSLSLPPPNFELMSGGIRLRPAATSASRSPIALLSLQVCFQLAIACAVCARIFLYTEYIFPPLLLLCMTCIHIHTYTLAHTQVALEHRYLSYKDTHTHTHTHAQMV